MANELTVHQKNVVGFRQLAEAPGYQNRFKQVLNDRAPQFVASLVQLVSGSTYLAKCDPNTIMASAITAAALDLPIDKNLGFAHIVPYGDEAQFQMGYKGFIQLAIRSGQYRFINTCEVLEGELQNYNKVTGEVVIDPTKKTSEKIIGYAAYFKLMNGYEHAEYWTHDEVHAHAMRFSQAFKAGRNTPWKTDFPAMAKKTVIKDLLSHWGILSIEMRRAMTVDQGVIRNLDSDEVIYPDNEPKRPAQTGPEEQPAPGTTEVVSGNAGADAKPARKAADIEKPYEELQALCKENGVSEEQVHKFMQEKGLAGKATQELMQASDANMRTVIITWPSIVGAIKATKVE